MHHYTITPANPEAHLYTVELKIAAPSADGQTLKMPAWIPGSYMVRDYARNVVSINATCAGGDVALEKLDKSTWRAAPCNGELVVEAEIFAYDPSVRGAHLDNRHGFFNGTAVFLEVMGQSEQPCALKINPPPNQDDWIVATSMERDGAEVYGFGGYKAANYDELIDHPVEMRCAAHL